LLKKLTQPRNVVLLEAGILVGWKKTTCQTLFIYQILRIIQYSLNRIA